MIRLEWTQVRDSFWVVVNGERIAEIPGDAFGAFDDPPKLSDLNDFLACAEPM